MKAVILAAGRGMRIRPLSESVPKPMIPVINKPVMEFMIDLLRQHGFDQIIVSTSYLAKEIEHYFRDGSEGGDMLSIDKGPLSALKASSTRMVSSPPN